MLHCHLLSWPPHCTPPPFHTLQISHPTFVWITPNFVYSIQYTVLTLSMHFYCVIYPVLWEQNPGHCHACWPMLLQCLIFALQVAEVQHLLHYPVPGQAPAMNASTPPINFGDHRPHPTPPINYQVHSLNDIILSYPDWQCWQSLPNNPT